MMKSCRCCFDRKGFTLIELLIVVAIIAILAAIAIPNFLEAQVRAKVAKVQGEFYNINVALESYHIDWNWYPQDHMVYEHCAWDSGGLSPMDIRLTLKCLTTPIAYFASLPYLDPFGDLSTLLQGRYFYENVGDHWYVYDVCHDGKSPDEALRHHYPKCPYDPMVFPEDTVAQAFNKCYLWTLRSLGPDRGFEWDFTYPYDATNGTVSRGEILRIGP